MAMTARTNGEGTPSLTKERSMAAKDTRSKALAQSTNSVCRGDCCLSCVSINRRKM